MANPTTRVPNQQIVTTKVKGITDKAIQIQVPWQKAEYPLTIQRFPTGIELKHFKLGEVLTFTLDQGKKKKDDYDGSQAWHFYWNLVKVERPKVGDGETPKEVPASTPTPATAPAPQYETPGIEHQFLPVPMNEEFTNRRCALMQAREVAQTATIGPGKANLKEYVEVLEESYNIHLRLLRGMSATEKKQ